MVSNAANINKVKNHLQLNTKKTATYGIGNPDHGLDLTKSGRNHPVNEIPTLSHS